MQPRLIAPTTRANVRAALRPSLWSLRGKLALLLTCVLAGYTLLVVLFFPAQMNGAERTALEARASELASVLALYVAPAVEFDDRKDLERSLAVLDPVGDALSAAVISAEGQTLAAWHPERQGGSNDLHVEAPIGLKSGAGGKLVLSYSTARLRSSAHRNLLVTVAVSVALLLAGVIAALLFGGAFVRPIRRMADVAQLIAAGDLAAAEKELHAGAQLVDSGGQVLVGRDEVRALHVSFGAMLESLTDTSAVLVNAAQSLTKAVHNVSTTLEQQNAMISAHAAALQQTQATAVQVQQTSQTTAQRAGDVLRAAQRADEVGRAGEAAIRDTLEGMQTILEEVAQISRHIQELSDRTHEIGNITATVKDLADQSNMLALNAAIEAVRSGEHGKGFAVVAREIRSLADQSIQATYHVRDILGAVGGAATATVKITERGANRIQGGVAQMRSSGENIRELASIAGQSSAAVRQIVTTVAEQGQGMTQIFSAVKELDALMRDTQQQLESSNQAIGVVLDVSASISDLSRRFRI